jgi:WD40 repeat protein
LAFSRDGKGIAVVTPDNGYTVNIYTVNIHDAATGKNRQTLQGHKRSVCDVAFSADGKRLASGDESGTVKVWNLATGREESSTRLEPTRIGGGEYMECITALAFSPDGRRLAFCGRGTGQLRVWNLDTDKVDKFDSVPRNDRSLPCFAFSPDGQHLCAVDSTGTVREWDVATGRVKITPGARLDPLALAYLADGPRLAARGEDGSVYVQDAVSGKRKFSLRSKLVGPISSFAFSPDSKRIATRNGDKTVKVWDPATGRELFTLPGPLGDVSRASFSRDGRWLALVAEGIGKVFEDAQERFTIKSSDSRFVHLAYSPDGRALVARTDDGKVKVYGPLGGQGMSLNEDSGIVDIVFSPDGRRIASVSGGRGSGQRVRLQRLWEKTNENDDRLFELTNESVIRVVFTGDTAHIITNGPDGLRVWDETGQEGLTLRDESLNGVYSVAISPDGRYIAAGGEHNRLKAWDALTGQQKLSKGFVAWVQGPVNGVYFGPDSQRLVGGTVAGTVVWDVQTGQEVLTPRGRDPMVTKVFFSLDGRRIASTRVRDGTVRVCDALTGELQHCPQVIKGEVVAEPGLLGISPDGKYVALQKPDRKLPVFMDVETGAEKTTLKGDPGNVRSLNFSPDGLRCVTGEQDGTVRVWDARTGEEQLSLKGHTGAVWSVAFSWDGQRIVSGGIGKPNPPGMPRGELKVWSAVTGLEKLSLRGHAGPVTGVAFSRDGQRIVSGSQDGTVRVWEAPATAPAPQAPK